MDNLVNMCKGLIESHKRLFDRFMETLNLDEYELSWISFFTGVAFTMFITAIL